MTHSEFNNEMISIMETVFRLEDKLKYIANNYEFRFQDKTAFYNCLDRINLVSLIDTPDCKA